MREALGVAQNGPCASNDEVLRVKAPSLLPESWEGKSPRTCWP